MLVDHLFLFASEAAARAVLEPLGFGLPARMVDGLELPPSWDGSRVVPCRVIVGHEPRSAVVDGETMTWEADVYMPGFHINVALGELRADLVAMPECVLVTDRERGVPGARRSDFLLHTKVSEPTMDAVLGITPVFAGTGYPFGESDDLVAARAASSSTPAA